MTLFSPSPKVPTMLVSRARRACRFHLDYSARHMGATHDLLCWIIMVPIVQSYQQMRRRRPSGVTQTASLDYVGTSTYRTGRFGWGGAMGWTATHWTRPYPYIAYTHGQYRNAYLVWIICYQRIAVPYTQVSRSLTCPDAGSSDPCHAITDPSRSSRRQGEHAPERATSLLVLLADPGPPAAGYWLAGDRELGPTCSQSTVRPTSRAVCPGPGSISDD